MYILLVLGCILVDGVTYCPGAPKCGARRDGCCCCCCCWCWFCTYGSKCPCSLSGIGTVTIWFAHDYSRLITRAILLL